MSEREEGCVCEWIPFTDTPPTSPGSRAIWERFYPTGQCTGFWRVNPHCPVHPPECNMGWTRDGGTATWGTPRFARRYHTCQEPRGHHTPHTCCCCGATIRNTTYVARQHRRTLTNTRTRALHSRYHQRKAHR